MSTCFLHFSLLRALKQTASCNVYGNAVNGFKLYSICFCINIITRYVATTRTHSTQDMYVHPFDATLEFFQFKAGIQNICCNNYCLIWVRCMCVN